LPAVTQLLRSSRRYEHLVIQEICHIVPLGPSNGGVTYAYELASREPAFYMHPASPAGLGLMLVDVRRFAAFPQQVRTTMKRVMAAAHIPKFSGPVVTVEVPPHLVPPQIAPASPVLLRAFSALAGTPVVDGKERRMFVVGGSISWTRACGAVSEHCIPAAEAALLARAVIGRMLRLGASGVAIPGCPVDSAAMPNEDGPDADYRPPADVDVDLFLGELAVQVWDVRKYGRFRHGKSVAARRRPGQRRVADGSAAARAASAAGGAGEPRKPGTAVEAEGADDAEGQADAARAALVRAAREASNAREPGDAAREATAGAPGHGNEM
jgi:hypothetical protein